MLVNSGKKLPALARYPDLHPPPPQEPLTRPWPWAHFPSTDPHPPPPAHLRHSPLVLHPPRPPPGAPTCPAFWSSAVYCARNQGRLTSHRGVPRVAMGTAGLCDAPPRGRGGRRAHTVGIGPPRLGEIAGARSRSRPRSLPKLREGPCLHPVAGQWWVPSSIGCLSLNSPPLAEPPSPRCPSPTPPGDLTHGRRLCQAKRPSPCGGGGVPWALSLYVVAVVMSLFRGLRSKS